MWRRLEAMLLAESSSPSLNRAITLVSPYLPWADAFYNQSTVDRWAAATSAVQYTEEVGQNMADVLLQVASDASLRSHIPDDVWALLKKGVSLPPVCRGRSLGAGLDVLHVRGRRDIDILKLYYLLVWSEWNLLSDSVIDEMETSIKEDFGEVRMWRHREDLIERLNHILARLERGSGHLDQVKQAKEQYTKLRGALLKVTKAVETRTRTPPSSKIVLKNYTHSRVRVQDPT